jgi:hypothetical protein
MAAAGCLAGKIEPKASEMMLNGGSFYDNY